MLNCSLRHSYTLNPVLLNSFQDLGPAIRRVGIYRHDEMQYAWLGNEAMQHLPPAVNA
jgi:hypothetical protein